MRSLARSSSVGTGLNRWVASATALDDDAKVHAAVAPLPFKNDRRLNACSQLTTEYSERFPMVRKCSFWFSLSRRLPALRLLRQWATLHTPMRRGHARYLFHFYRLGSPRNVSFSLRSLISSTGSIFCFVSFPNNSLASCFFPDAK